MMANAVSAGGTASLVVFNRIGDVAASLKPGDVVAGKVTAVGDDGTVTVNLNGVPITARSEILLQPGMQALFRVASLGAANADIALRFLGYQDTVAPQSEQSPAPQPDQLPDFSANALGDTVSAQVSGTTPDGGTILKFPDGFLTVKSDIPLAQGETVLFKLVPSTNPGEIDFEFAGYNTAGGASQPPQAGLLDSLGDTVMRALAAVAAGSLTQEAKGLTKDARAELTGLLARFTAQRGGMPQQIENLITLASEAGVEPGLLEKLRDLLIDMEKMNPGELRQALEKSGVLLENRLRDVLDGGLRQSMDTTLVQQNEGEELPVNFTARLSQLQAALEELTLSQNRETTAGLRPETKGGSTTEQPELNEETTPQQIESLVRLASKAGGEPEILKKLGLPVEELQQNTGAVLQPGRGVGEPSVEGSPARLLQLPTSPEEVPPSTAAAGSPTQGRDALNEDAQADAPALLARLMAQKGEMSQQIESLVRLVSKGGLDPKLVEKLRDFLIDVEKSNPGELRQGGNPKIPQQEDGVESSVVDFKARLLQLQAALEEIPSPRNVPMVAIGGQRQEAADDANDVQAHVTDLLAQLTAQKGALPQQIENLVRLAGKPEVDPELREKLRDLLADMEKMNPAELRQALDRSVPPESRLRSVPDVGLRQEMNLLQQARSGGQSMAEDFKARLLQVMKALQEIPTSSRGPAVEKALDAAQGMLREVEQYQSLSRVSDSFASFLPLSWQGLAGGDAEFRQRGGSGEEAASSCRLNLDLEEYGRLSVMVMFVKRGFSLYFRADEPRFRDLLSSRTAEIRGLFAKSGLFLRSVDVLDGESPIIEQLEASMEPVERAMSLTV